VCTVLIRLAPGNRWPVLLGAVRDEFVDRSWDPPGRHWAGAASRLLGGRDRTAGGTWLAVDPGPKRPAVAALVNGLPLPPLPMPAAGVRPTRGTLALTLLTTRTPPTAETLAGYDRFHLLLATLEGTDVWSWDGGDLDYRRLAAGEHILVNHGLDAAADPLVPHFRPLLVQTPTPDPRPGLPPVTAWGRWLELLAGDGLDPADPRALIMRRVFDGRAYGSTSACLVALSASGVRYDFTADPSRPSSWYEVATGP
jgi:Transport and Golgi organisation 2